MTPATQKPTVTAGLRCAPVNWLTEKTAIMTAMPQPHVMTIQPEFWALDLLSRTAATTPSPKRIRSAVPTISQPMMCKRFSLLDNWGQTATLIRRVRQCQTQFAHLQISPSVRPRVSTGLPRNIQSIERAAAILRLLSGRTRRLGVVDLAGELGLPKGTVHGILRTLQHVGFVEQDEETGKYQLGAALLHMGSSYLDGNELRTRALNWSDSLAARTNESVRIGTLHEGQVLIVHHVFRPDDSLPDARRRARCCRPTPARWARSCSPTTRTRPASWRATGLESFTPATITDPDVAASASSSASASAAGRPTSASSSTARCRCAAPIQDRRGVTVGAMGVSGPPDRLLAARQPRGDLVAFVREAARAVSRELGAIPW